MKNNKYITFMKTIILPIIFIFLIVFLLPAEESVDFNSNLDFAQVEFVKAVHGTNNSWSFYVTLRHSDEGWSHYANLWEVVDPESGNVFAERVLAHPHETEQPFTRSQSGIVFPENQQFVVVRARCTLHGFEGKTVLVNLKAEEGEGYRLQLK